MNETFADGGLTLTTGRVAILTIARAERRNAATQAMWAELPDVCESIEARGDIRALIVRGARGSCILRWCRHVGVRARLCDTTIHPSL